jgi:Protein of unknown function (DUF2827)
MSDNKHKPAPIRVGITFPDKGSKTQNIWSSGLVQNAVFIYRTLKLIPGVKPFALGSFPLARELGLEHTTKGPGYLNVVIEAATKLDPNSALAFRISGGRIIHHAAGNAMFLNMEHVATGSTVPDIPYGNYDAVWLLPHLFDSNVSYYASMFKCPVERVPMVWDPEFMDKDWPVYQPDQKFKYVGIFEPSVSVVKTPHVPILIAERCNQLDPNFGPMIHRLKIFSALDKAENSVSFKSFLDALSIKNSADLEPRISAKSAFQGLSCVLTHTFENGLNYNWNEALYAGYPLVHNSDLVKAGYKYDSWMINDAAHLLRNVLKNHDDPEIRGHYEFAAKQWLATMNPQVVAPVYAKLLSSIVGRQL